MILAFKILATISTILLSWAMLVSAEYERKWLIGFLCGLALIGVWL